MKKIIAIILAVMMVIGCVAVGATSLVSLAAETTNKVEASVSSNGATVISGAVKSDYTASVVINKEAVVNANDIAVSASVSNIDSLGIDETRTISKTFRFGEKEFAVNDYIPALRTATVNGAIDGVEYSYDIATLHTDFEYIINAVPSNEEGARKAFAEIAKYVDTSVQSENSFVSVPNTAYIQVGTQKVSLANANGELKFDNLVMEDVLIALDSALKYETAEKINAQIEMYLPEGTTVAVGQTVATLKKSMTVTVLGITDIMTKANADIKVNVEFGKDKITLDKTKIVTSYGPKAPEFVLTATSTIKDAKIVWSSSDESVATVDENGKVTTHKAGTAVITAATEDGTLSAECTVVVNYNFFQFIYNLILTLLDFVLTLFS